MFLPQQEFISHTQSVGSMIDTEFVVILSSLTLSDVLCLIAIVVPELEHFPSRLAEIDEQINYWRTSLQPIVGLRECTQK